jgi:L-cysteate sulfo-lyase
VRLGHLPTPLEPMARLSAHLGGPTLCIKRDDCTGLATGGNKTRKLEFLVADALAQGADTLITLGALQSNHARQTAAAAAKLGLKCVLVLEERVSQATDAYRHNGNVLLDRLLGATVKYVPRDNSMTAASEMAADEVRRAGGRPYVIPGGGSNAIGALGYVGCALEILQQAAGLGVRIDRAVHATGSSGEGVLLDPVYSGKAMSGLIDLVRRRAFGKDENIVFVHTGGQAGLFAYEPAFAA